MMRSKILISAAVLASSAASAAEAPLVVSAGEHGEYSRIVVAGGDSQISIETSGRMVRLRNVDTTAKIDLADVNDRQKAYRIENATIAAPGVIELQMNCDCAVRTLRTPEGKIVIDIASPAETVATAQRTNAPTQLIAPSPTTVQSAPDDALTVAQAHDRMVELLQQAASDGLIMLKDAPKPAQRETGATGSGAGSNADGHILRQPAVGDEIAEHTARPERTPTASSATPALPASASAPQAANVSRRCLGDSVLHINGDEFETNPLIAIEDLQARLAETTGAEKNAVAGKLASGFLAIGFGEEAMAVLKDADKPAGAMSEIAQIVAEHPVDPSGVILGAKSCTSTHALWQAAAAAGPEAAGYFELSGTVVKSLPHRLQALMLGRLAVKMVDLEAWDAAQRLLDIADEDGENQSPELKYVRIRLADRETKSDDARASLLEVATDESAASDDALLALAASYAEQGGAPHEGFIEDIGALAKIGGSSRAAFFEAYSWAQAGNVGAALLLLQNEAPKSPENAKMAETTAISIISRALSDDDSLLQLSALEAFLKHESWIDPSANQGKLRVGAADFASDIGLPNLSYELLKNIGPAQDRTTSEKLASAALDAGDTDEAIRYAAPFASDAEFGAIITSAKIRQQDYHAALATAATISDEKKRARLKSRAGWLSRNWQAARDGFRSIDPSELDDAAATQFGLTAFMSGDTALPGVVDAALSENASTIKSGLHSLFINTFSGTALQRARSISDATSKEISAFEEILSDG